MLTFKHMINILDGNLKPYEKIQKLFFKSPLGSMIVEKANYV